MKKLIIIIVILSIAQIGYSQKYKRKANRAFEDLEYYDAIKYYNKHLNKHPDDSESLLNLGKCYKNTNQFYLAEDIYSKLKNEFDKFPNQRLDYAFILLSNGKVDKAKKEVIKFLDKNPNDDKANVLLKSCNQQVKFLASKDKYSLNNAFFNSDVSDFSPVFYKDGFMYTSEKGSKKDHWTGRSYTNIFFVTSGEKPVMIDGIAGKYHNGNPSFIDENHMIFTRNNTKKTKDGSYNLILKEAIKEKGEWKLSKDFPYNKESFNVAYPTVSTDGKIMIFSSDMPGGKGGMDLYVSKRINNHWSEPRNLSTANSPGNDMFPYLDNSNNLFFATDGRSGLGGLDIFSASFIDGVVGEIKNLGAPLNSSRDDFGLITKDNLKTGYFSSNRLNDEGIDNVYSFQKNKENIKITGIVVDEMTKIPLKETLVTLYNETTGESLEYLTAENGRFSFEGKTQTNYKLQGVKNDILTTSELFDTYNASSEKPFYYTLIHNDPRFSLEGTAINVKDKKGVESVNITRFNSTNSKEIKQVTDSKGFFKFQLEQDSDFEISGEKNGFYTSVSTATTKGLNRSTTLYVKLFLTIEEVIIGDTKILGKETFGGWEFENIYYDLDKYNIRSDAATALDKVVDFLNANSSLTIELGSHTDGRASDSYNMKLSQNRADAAIEYIITKGIDKSRITAKGYGESKLTNLCTDGVSCSEMQHQMNRRTEITVTGY